MYVKNLPRFFNLPRLFASFLTIAFLIGTVFVAAGIIH